jgi:hypothetical protein
VTRSGSCWTGAIDALEHKVRIATQGIDLVRDTHRANQALEEILGTMARAPKQRAGGGRPNAVARASDAGSLGAPLRRGGQPIAHPVERVAAPLGAAAGRRGEQTGRGSGAAAARARHGPARHRIAGDLGDAPRVRRPGDSPRSTSGNCIPRRPARSFTRFIGCTTSSGRRISATC